MKNTDINGNWIEQQVMLLRKFEAIRADNFIQTNYMYGDMNNNSLVNSGRTLNVLKVLFICLLLFMAGCTLIHVTSP